MLLLGIVIQVSIYIYCIRL